MNVEATAVISTTIIASYTKAINTVYNFIIYNFTISNNSIPRFTISLVIIFCRYKVETTRKTKDINKPKN